MPEDNKTFTASCLCTSSILTFTVPTSSLPLKTHFCHCAICRHTHGTLATLHTPIPAPTFDFTKCTAYATSPRVVRYFCSTCGAHVGDVADKEGVKQWYVSTSLVDAPEETWDFYGHIYLNGTRDGGLSVWLDKIGGKALKRGSEGKADWQLPSSATDAAATDRIRPSEASQDEKRDGDKLRARCHCGGVDFWIARPGPKSFVHMPPTLTPKDTSKWYASHDACTSCRLSSSLFVTSWCFPAVSAITLADGSPYTPEFGTIKTYKSSEDVLRGFCGVCGALVSYQCDDRKEIVDIAVGLLEADGVRAEEWLEWRTHKVGYMEDAVWKGVVGDFERGLQAWGQSHGQE